jgi:hypothetical protein
MRRVSEGENVFARDDARGFLAEAAIIGGGVEKGQLFDQIPSQMVVVDFLAGEVVKDDAIHIGDQDDCIVGIGRQFAGFVLSRRLGKNHRQGMPRANARNHRCNHRSGVCDRRYILDR